MDNGYIMIYRGPKVSISLGENYYAGGSWAAQTLLHGSIWVLTLLINIYWSVSEKEIHGNFFFYLKEHPLRGNFRNFKKILSMAIFFIDPQSFFS